MLPPDLSRRIQNTLAGRSGPLIMGVMNVTPDSFSAQTRVSTPKEALEKATFFLDAGADILDIGAESTRPGFSPLTKEVERERLFPVLDLIARLPIPLSIDTRNPIVMEEAMAYAPSIINDTGGLGDPGFFLLMQKHPHLLGVVMHGAGSGVSKLPKENHFPITRSVSDFFLTRKAELSLNGITSERLLFDPGIGFGKNALENLTLIRNIHRLIPGFPILLGVSRKRFLGEISGEEIPENRDPPTLAILASVFSKIALFRVHDVKGTHSFRKTLLALAERTFDDGP